MARIPEIPTTFEEVRQELCVRSIPDHFKALAEYAHLTYGPEPFSHYLIDAFTSDEIERWVFLKSGEFALEEQKLLVAQRTDFGAQLATVTANRDFIDLGCGFYPVSSIIARACNARRYIGVDCAQENTFTRDTLREQDSFYSVYFRNGILQFLGGIRELQGVIFHLSGLEPFELQGIPKDKYKDKVYVESQIYDGNNAYINACMIEMQRLSKPEDAVLIGEVTYGFHPEQYGFNSVIKDNRTAYKLFQRV